ncbi:MAG: Crp/Fnr family transcriptional regulator [Geminicoccaceae bacterium]
MPEPWSKAGIEALLLRGDWFAGLPEALRATLVAAGKVRHLGAGATIHAAGRGRCDLQAVLAGTARLFRLGPGGHELVYHVAGPGFWFGALTALTGLDAGVTVVAETPVALFVIPAREVARLVDQDGSWFAALAQLSLERFVLALQTIEHVTRPGAVSRVAARLLVLAQLQIEADRLAAPILAMSQSALAAATGLSRQAVNRALRRLARDRLVTTGFRRIGILDPAGLQRVAETGG